MDYRWVYQHIERVSGIMGCEGTLRCRMSLSSGPGITRQIRHRLPGPKEDVEDDKMAWLILQEVIALMADGGRNRRGCKEHGH